MAALNNLKVQHAGLLKSLPAHPSSDSSRFMQASLPITAEEEEQPVCSPRLTPISRQSRSASIATSVSDSVHDWFDALDGAEEFVMDMQVTLEGSELPSQLSAHDARSAVSQQEDSSVDTDIEENVKARSIPGPFSETSAVVRRTRLPAYPAGDEGSLFAILKKNVGKVCTFFNFKHRLT